MATLGSWKVFLSAANQLARGGNDTHSVLLNVTPYLNRPPTFQPPLEDLVVKALIGVSGQEFVFDLSKPFDPDYDPVKIEFITNLNAT
jgi:hypothetical protein